MIRPVRRFPAPPLAAAACLLAVLMGCLAGCDTGSGPRRPSVDRDGWVPVGFGPLYGISGAALHAHDPAGGRIELLVCHDSKRSGQPRVGLVAIDPGGRTTYRPLRWPSGSPEPFDLEAVAAIPGAPGEHLLLTSTGEVIRLAVVGGRPEVRARFALPDVKPRHNFEGFALLRAADGRLIAAWADRGDGSRPGTLFRGVFDPAANRLTQTGHDEVRLPWPKGGNARTFGDLWIDPAGVVWAVATEDPGDAGPFKSAVYIIGTLHPDPAGDDDGAAPAPVPAPVPTPDAKPGRSPKPAKTRKPSAPDRSGIRFEAADSPVRLYIADRKIEAVVGVPGAGGGMIFGTDDEDMGGYLYWTGGRLTAD